MTAAQRASRAGLLGEAAAHIAKWRGVARAGRGEPRPRGVVSHEPEPSAERPVKGRKPGAHLITAIASWIFHWHVGMGSVRNHFAFGAGIFSGSASYLRRNANTAIHIPSGKLTVDGRQKWTRRVC
jgi:hypothetical protein